VATLCLATTARADGDPASDVLVTSNTFFPSPPPAREAQTLLSQSVQAVLAKQDRVKIAVIESVNDLGSVPSLFGKPQAYAKFLGLELRNVYSGALLIVMPQGFGFYSGGGPTGRATGVLDGISISDTSADGLTRSAAKAVDKLEAAGTLHFKDEQAPQVYVIPTTGHRGTPMLLRYWGLDDSGQASIAGSVTRGTKVLMSFRTALKAVTPSLIYSFKWRVPSSTRLGPAAFCARATDGAGRRSAKSCTVIKVT
jgi:hypothetical protein